MGVVNATMRHCVIRLGRSLCRLYWERSLLFFSHRPLKHCLLVFCRLCVIVRKLNVVKGIVAIVCDFTGPTCRLSSVVAQNRVVY